jgi:phosphate transport system protein
MKKFDQELAVLRDEIVNMGAIAQSMVSMAIGALTDLQAVYDKVRAAEDQLDQKQLYVDHEAVRLLTVYSPVAANLRFVLSVTHVNNALERIGDQALGLCHNLDFAGKHAAEATSGPALARFQRMGELTQAMVRDALLAFSGEDAILARATIAHDDLVDAINDDVQKEILSDDVVREGIAAPRSIAGALTHLLIARSLERIADQATNICEEVIYMVKGDDVRHRPKAKR